MIVYKIVEHKDNNFYTLFHGVEHSRKLPFNTWIKAEKKLVRDGSGGKIYLSGIHCFRTLEIAQEYLSRFKNLRNRIIIKCEAHTMRYKPTNHNVILADEIFISSKNA